MKHLLRHLAQFRELIRRQRSHPAGQDEFAGREDSDQGRLTLRRQMQRADAAVLRVRSALDKFIGFETVHQANRSRVRKPHPFGERWVASDLKTHEPIWESVGDEGLEKKRHLERFAEIAYATGTRAGAILALGWRPARLNGYVDFAPTTLHRAGPDEEVTRKRQQACRIPDSLVPKLKAWQEADMAEAQYLASQTPTVEMPDRIIRYGNADVSRIGQSFETAVRRACLDRREIDGALRVGNPDPKNDMG